MKTFILFLILGICKAMADTSECEEQPVSLILDPICGILPDCYLSAYNSAELEIASCMRKKNGLEGVSSTRKGKCPTDKPSCPNLFLE